MGDGRRQGRLASHDYTSGMYFVTMCIQGRESLFGSIVDGVMQPSEAGLMIAAWWNELANKFPAIDLDVYMVMPDHFHGLIAIHGVGADLRVRPDNDAQSNVPEKVQGAHIGAPLRPPSGEIEQAKRHVTQPALGQVMQWFKTMTTNAYIQGVHERGWPEFTKRLWQRNYYDHIIRDERDLNHCRQYIITNPARHEERRHHINRIT